MHPRPGAMDSVPGPSLKSQVQEKTKLSYLERLRCPAFTYASRAEKRLLCGLYFLRRWMFHSALATRMSSSSSLIGIQLVSTFMAFSKSESSRISRVPSMSAADVACRTSRPPSKLCSAALRGERDRSGSASPSSKKTSQTRNWAGNGIE